MSYDCGKFTLPTIEFVGGETQKLVFNIYANRRDVPFSLDGTTCNFSATSFVNRTATPAISKDVEFTSNDDDNVLEVTLSPTDTVELSGKYIYQISIKDEDGVIEIPSHGIMYITANINKSFVYEEVEEET